MTERIRGCWVAFERDIRVDDVEPLIEAIKRLRGVQAVEEKVADDRDWMARERAIAELRDKMKHILWPALFDGPDKEAR